MKCPHCNEELKQKEETKITTSFKILPSDKMMLEINYSGLQKAMDHFIKKERKNANKKEKQGQTEARND